MKKIMALLLCSLLFLTALSGCSRHESSESDELQVPNETATTDDPFLDELQVPNETATTDDPFLAELLNATETAKLDHASINTEGASYSILSPYSVRITKGLLRDIVDAIISGNPKRLEPEVKTYSSSGLILIQFSSKADQFVLIHLISGLDEQPGKSLMILQIGEESLQYTLNFSIHQEIQKLIAAQTSLKEIVLEGSYIRYDPVRADLNDGQTHREDVLEKNGKLLFLWHNRECDYWLEEVNPKTGEAAVIWEYTSSRSWDPLKLEDTDYGEFDYRIKGNHMTVYLSSLNPDLLKLFEAPVDSGDNRRFSYDIRPETGYIAYSIDDGVYVGREGKMVKVLDNKDLKAESSIAPEEFDPYYGDVHLINGGRQLVVMIVNPGSMIMVKSLMLIDTNDGAVTPFENLFTGNYNSEVRYIDDKIVMAREEEQVTKIDVESKQSELLPAVMNSSTCDFNTYVSLPWEMDETGMRIGLLMAYSFDSGQEKQMLKLSGENASLFYVTDNSTGIRCKDGKEAYIAIVPF